MGRGASVVSLGPEWLAADDSTAVYELGGSGSLRACSRWKELAPGGRSAAVEPID